MQERTKRLTTLAVIAAIAFLVMLVLRIKIFDFLTLDVKDTVIVTGGLLYGPMASLMISLVVSLLEMVTVSSTAWWGLLMNALSSCAFACTAAFVYKRVRTLPGAVAGLIAGWLLATAVMLPANYIIAPLYSPLSRADVAGILLTVFLPFNLIKYGLNTAITALIYKPLVNALRSARLLPMPKEQSGSGKPNMGVMLGAGILLLALIVIIILKVNKVI